MTSCFNVKKPSIVVSLYPNSTPPTLPIKYKIFSRRKPKRFLISLKYYNQKLPLPCQINVQNSDKCSFPNNDLCKLNFYKKKLILKFHFCKF